MLFGEFRSPADDGVLWLHGCAKALENVAGRRLCQDASVTIEATIVDCLTGGLSGGSAA